MRPSFKRVASVCLRVFAFFTLPLFIFQQKEQTQLFFWVVLLVSPDKFIRNREDIQGVLAVLICKIIALSLKSVMCVPTSLLFASIPSATTQKYLMGVCKEDRARLSLAVLSDRARGNTLKWKRVKLSEHRTALFYCGDC